MTKFVLPDIGEGVKDVTVTDILVTKNQSVKKEDILIVVESEKASMEIPAEFDCIISQILVKEGDVVCPGQQILMLNDGYKSQSNLNDKSIDSTVEEPKNIENSKEKSTLNKADAYNKEKEIYASPSVRKLARELDCDLLNVNGTGKNGRITLDDVHHYVKNNQISLTSEITAKANDDVFNEASKWGFSEKTELNNIKTATAKKMVDSWNRIPHVTQFDECDITELDKIRKLLKKNNVDPNIKVSFIPFFMKSIVKTIKRITIFNSSLSEDGKYLIQKKYYNIGVAVNTERGLVVPVIKDVDKKSIKQLSKELTILVNKAKNKRLSIDDMSGGCITISSLGGISGKFFTPIINPPEVAILGISKMEIKPIMYGSKFKPRKILPISLSYDHRVVDGVDAAEFTKLFSKIISNPGVLVD